MVGGKIQKTGGLLDQWTLLSEIIADKRTRKPHIQVAQVVIDRQKHEHGNGCATLSVPPASQNGVSASLRQNSLSGATLPAVPVLELDLRNSPQSRGLVSEPRGTLTNQF